jgi:CMP/dCMP kinase
VLSRGAPAVSLQHTLGEPVIVAIDGVAGAGKSSTALGVASAAGLVHFNSGAFYRSLAFAAGASGRGEVTQWESLTYGDVERLGVRFRRVGPSVEIAVGGVSVVDRLWTADLAQRAGAMAQILGARMWVRDQARMLADGTDLVADGRDIGTWMFPDAEVKVFMTADVSIRALRCLRQRGVHHPAAEEIDTELARLRARDKADFERRIEPLRPAPDALLLDTSAMSVEAQVDAILQRIAAVRAR